MITVIKEGNINEHSNHIKVCGFCHCVFEYDAENVQEIVLRDRGEIYRCIDCPTCGDTLSVPKPFED